MQSSIKAIILDSNKIFREALRCVLSQFDATEITETCSMMDYFDQLKIVQPDVAFITLSYQDETAMKILSLTHMTCSSTKVFFIVLNMYPELRKELMDAGAAGILDSDMICDQIKPIIEHLAATNPDSRV